MSDYTNKIKKWVEKDKKKGVHVYTGFKDIDGIELAERMVLVGAWYGDEKRLYYVKKDTKKNKYYLQSFGENFIFAGEYFNKEFDKVKSRGIGIHRALEEYQVLYDDKCVPTFLEDYGYHEGKFPHRNVFINGELVFEEVTE